MPVPTNIGSFITRTNTGWNAVTSGYTIPTLSTHTGTFNTTATGQVIDAYNITGRLNVRHDNVQILRCGGVQVEVARKIRGTKIWHSTFGLVNGLIEDTWGTTLINGSDILIQRCNLFGAIDHTRPRYGKNIYVETWFGPPFSDPLGHQWPPGTAPRRAHCDVCQPHSPEDGATHPYEYTLIQGCKIDTFPFNKGQTYLAELNRIQGGGLTEVDWTAGSGGNKVADIGGWPATCGTLNVEFGDTRNHYMFDNEIDGNYFQFLMHQNQGQKGEPKGMAFGDNIIVQRRALYGDTGFVNVGGTNGNTAIEWGRNLRKHDGATIPCFYKTGSNGRVLPLKARTDYPDFYRTNPKPDDDDDDGGGNPNPVISLQVESPADGSTHTSGSVLFKGSADEAAGDSDDKYSWFDYYVIYPRPTVSDPDATATAFLDHDSPVSNTGFTFTVTTAGTVVTDRSSVQHTILGPATLQVRGTRNDGTFPTAEVDVIFGEPTEAPEATEIEFSADITATMTGAIEIDTATGGIDTIQVERVSRLEPTGYKTVWYFRDKRPPHREVQWVNGVPVHKRSTS